MTATSRPRTNANGALRRGAGCASNSRADRNAASIDFGPRPLHDVAPFFVFAANQPAEVLGRAAGGLGADCREFVPEGLRREGLVDFAVEPRDDGFGHARRR